MNKHGPKQSVHSVLTSATKLVAVQSYPGKVPHHSAEFLCANTMVAIVLLNVSVTLGDANGWLKHLLRKYTPLVSPHCHYSCQVHFSQQNRAFILT